MTEILWKGGRVQGWGQEGPSRNRWEMKVFRRLVKMSNGSLAEETRNY